MMGVVSALGQNNTITIPDVSVAKGKSISLPINMDNTADVVAVQFTLTVPDGMTLNPATASLTDRSDEHTVRFQAVGSNKYMAMVFSSQNKAIKGRTGKLLSVSLSASTSLEEGTEHSLSLSDVVIGARDGSNLVTGFCAGKVTIAKSPDLEVSQIAADKTTINPGEQINVSWTVANIGGFNTTGGWSEQILLANDQGATKLLGTLYNDDILESGGTISRNTELTMPTIIGMDGDCRIVVKVVPNSNAGEPSWLQNNNISQTANTISVKKQLSLSPDYANVDESNAETIRFQLNRSGDTSDEEVFALTRNADDRIVIPESITIEKGESSTFFYAQVVANQTLDNDSIVRFRISGNDYPEISSVINIEDDTYPSLSISTAAQDVTEGGSITFSVGTERVSQADIEIKMTCDFSSRFKIPSNIIIPAGQTSIDVNVDAAEDDVPNNEEVVTFTATAAKHNPASINTVLVDNDVPTLQLEITPTAVSEAAGPLAVTAKLRRTDNIDKVVTVKFSDDADGNLYYGRQTIVLEKGIEEATVNLGPIDNALVDGERTYNISAAVWIASCSCNANNGTSGGIVSVPLTVYDNDGPALSMTSTTSVLNEGSEMTVSVKRNTSTEEQMVVRLNSDHDADIEYPTSVNIPAGEREVSFTVKSRGNEITGDGFTATLNATADGFATGNIWFSVSDQTLPDAQIAYLNVSTNEVEASGSITVETTITNTGSYELPELTKVGIYLSNSSSPIATLYLQQPLRAGEETTLTRAITMPSSIGVYDVYAVVNDGNEIKELCNTNNNSKIQKVKTISPYTFRIQSDKNVYKPGDEILISGNITGKDVSEKEVEIYVINNSYRHIINASTDENGNFSCNYTPFSGQLGKFDVGACYPGEFTSTCMVSFEILGIKRTSNKAITFEPIVGEQHNGSFEIANYSSSQLTNVKAEIISQPENINITINCPSIIEANGRFNLEYAVDAISPSIGNDWDKIILNITSTEGASLQTNLYCYSRNKTGKLKSSINRIQSTMNIETPRDYNFVISNIGKGETGSVTLELPSWMTYVTPKEIPSLQSGDSVTVAIRFTPAANMQINVPVTGYIGLNCTNGEGLSIPYYIEPVSESTGVLTVDVCDEFTYYTSEAPHVSGASVIVRHPTTGKVIAESKTGADGIYAIELPEGYYTVAVSAYKHQSYTNNIYINPGQDNKIVVNLGYTAITYNWEVVETEVEDEYSISTRVVYETNVPVPCVVINMPEKIDGDNMAINESTVIPVTLTNKGLVTALNVTLEMPENTDEWVFEPLSSIEPFDLPAMQSVIVPVQITRISNGSYRAKARIDSRANIVDNFKNCMAVVAADYEELCGEEIKNNKAVERMAMKMCATAATGATLLQFISQYIPAGSGGTSGPGGGPGGGGDNYHNPETDTHPITTGHTFNLCDTCDANRAEALIDFLLDKTFLASVNTGANIATKSSQEMRENGGQDVVRRRMTQSAFEQLVEELKQQRRETALGEHGAEVVGSIEDIIEVIDIITEECPTPSEEQQGTAKGKSKARTITRSWQEEYFQVARRTADYLRNYDAFLLEFFGDRVWFEGNMDEMNDMFTLLCKDDAATLEQVLAVKPRFVTDEQVKNLYERILGGEKGYGGTNNINWDKVEEYAHISDSIDEQSITEGYPSLADQYQQAYDTCIEGFKGISQSVCASITLQFSQKMVMTRQAFRGTLTVFNGHETDAMRDVKLTLEVKDEDGNVATSHEFQINPENLTGFDGELNISSGWTLDAGQTGVSTIMFIPTKYAAPTVEKCYAFGGTLSYVDPFTGLTVTRTLAPVTLTVKPSPNLDLTYFMQRDIKGDDPLTLDVVEPCEEAEFSLLINNIGNGDATDVRMFTEQPEIIDNEKGLLIDFEIISSQLNGSDKTLALGGTIATDFGTIPAKSTAYAQWWIKSSLLGHFTDYNVEATHVTSYDNPDLSLLNDVTIHELVRSLEVEDGNTKLVGFMTNDIVDAEDTPDMLYLSNGEIETVSSVQNISISKVSDTDYSMTVATTQNGWNYGNVVDPTYGISALKSVVRQSDGKEMSLRNFWQTDRTLQDGKDPLYENRIHFADNIVSAGSETYILTFEPVPDLLLEVASFEGIPEEGSLSIEPVNNIRVVFNKNIDPATFTTDDISLAVQGVKQDISLMSVSTDDNKTFMLDLSPLNENIGNGYFVLTVNTSDVKDAEGYMGKNGKQAGWIMYRDGLVQLNTTTYPATAGVIQKKTESSNAKTLGKALSEENHTEYGSKVTLTTIPNNGYEFKNWTINGDVVSSEPDLEYVALGDMDIKANFAPKTYSVTIYEPNEGGVITGAGSGVYSYGDVLNLAANADEDFAFDGWEVNDLNNGKENELSVIVNEAKNIKANFRREVFKQSLTMSKGWNWISSYVNEPIPVSNVLGNINHIVSQFDELINDPIYGMIGGIESLVPGIAYKMNVSYSSMKSFKGHLHDLTNTPIELHKGWNWISYPYAEEKRINEVLSNASEGDYMTSQFGFSEFADGYWEGTLNSLIPGYGYIYKSSADKTLEFDFSNKQSEAKVMLTNSRSDESDSGIIDARKYPSTMNIIARISTDTKNTIAEKYRIYAFAGNELRGESRSIGDNHYITIYGDNATDLTFVVEDITNGNTFLAKENATFIPDVLGSRKAPFTITVSETTAINNVIDSSHKMKIYSIEGVLIDAEATAESLKKLSRGIYIIDGHKFMVK